jgi:hypothetical protein
MYQSQFVTVECRSPDVLDAKVSTRKAAGWVADGPMVEITGYTLGHRHYHRYSQSMRKKECPKMHWQPLR